MKVNIVRGALLNKFELQNYEPLIGEIDIQAISSKKPISSDIKIPLVRLWSPADLPNFPFKFPILNRIFVDAQKLFGLEKVIAGSDIVHVAETYFNFTNQAIIEKRKGNVKKIVSTVWETIPFNNEGIRGRKRFKKLAYENIDHYITPTERAKNALIEEGVNPKKISVVRMGVDLDRFKPKNKRKTGKINILCVSRLTPEKGIKELVAAFEKIYKDHKNIILTLVGNGALKTELTGYKNIFVKNIPYNKIHHEYHKADIFCLPSQTTKYWEEQYGMALVEAMACGLPIVTTQTGAIPEVCGDSALYSLEKNQVSLYRNLLSLIENPELRVKMGKISRIRAKKEFDRQKTAREYKEIYNKLLCR